MAAQAPHDHGPVPYRWVVFSILAMGYVLVFFHRMCPAVVALDLMRDLHTGPALMGLLASAYFYPYALMQLPAGLLSDSWGPRRSVTSFFLVAGVASLFFGAAWSAASAVTARVMVGLGVAMVFVPTTKILTRWFTQSQFVVMTGVLLALGGVGAYGSSQPLAWLSAELGWRVSFWIIGGISLAVAVLIWLLVRDSPADKGFPPPEPSPVADGGSAAPRLLRGMKLVLADRRFYPIAAWFFCSGVVFFGICGLWAGPYVMHVHGMDKASAGGVLSMISVGMIVGSPFLGWLSNAVGSRKKVLVGCMILLSACCAVLAFFPAEVPVPMLYALMALMATGSAASSAVGFTAAKELFPVEISGTAVGLVNGFPFLGGALGQPLLGWVLQRHGGEAAVYGADAYQQVFFICLGSALAAVVFACLIRETYGTSAD